MSLIGTSGLLCVISHWFTGCRAQTCLRSQARANGIKIGIDSRLIPYSAAAKLIAALTPRASSLVFPWQNLIDLLWKTRPARPREPVYIQGIEFTGEHAKSKLSNIRKWIKTSAPETGMYTTKPPNSSQIPVATFMSNLASIAWTLNLRGSDIPFNPVFQAYLFVEFDRAILFVDSAKLSPEISNYLQSIGVTTREYSDVWFFLRARDWGEGKVSVPKYLRLGDPHTFTCNRFSSPLTLRIQSLAASRPSGTPSPPRSWNSKRQSRTTWSWLDLSVHTFATEQQWSGGMHGSTRRLRVDTRSPSMKLASDSPNSVLAPNYIRGLPMKIYRHVGQMLVGQFSIGVSSDVDLLQ